MIETTDGRVVARSVEHADTFLKAALGLMFRRSMPQDHALVIELKRDRRVGLHMLFVPFDIDAVFLDPENRVRKVERLRAWTGMARGRALRVVELPAGAADSLEPGDRLRFDQ